MSRSRMVSVAAVLVMGTSALVACSSRGSQQTATTTTSRPDRGPRVTVVIKDSKGTNGPMTMTVSPNATTAGPVTFAVRNAGTVAHQFIVVRTDAPALTPGPDQRVSAQGTVGAIRRLAPGATKSLALTLTAGKYQLMCNLPGHYALGLHVVFTAT